VGFTPREGSTPSSGTINVFSLKAFPTSATPALAGLQDRRLQPQFDEPEHPAIADAAGHARRQRGVGNRIEVLRPIGVHNLGVSLVKGARCLANRLAARAAGRWDTGALRDPSAYGASSVDDHDSLSRPADGRLCSSVVGAPLDSRVPAFQAALAMAAVDDQRHAVGLHGDFREEVVGRIEAAPNNHRTHLRHHLL
jgi:hypothetical protein